MTNSTTKIEKNDSFNSHILERIYYIVLIFLNHSQGNVPIHVHVINNLIRTIVFYKGLFMI